MERDWAYLEVGILDLILDKLEERIDHVWFGKVCKNWCSAAKFNHQNKQFRSNVLPMLMIRTKRKRRRRVKSLYSIPGTTLYPFLSPMIDNKRFCGSSQGWLATLDDDARYVINLTNPFKNVASIALPKLRSLMSNDANNVSKVVLSVDPLIDPHDYVVAVIHNKGSRLAFIRAGQEIWDCVEHTGNVDYTDVTFYKGLLYALSGRKFIVSFNPYYRRNKNIIQNIVYANYFNETKPLKRSYLVKSLEGDLWMVTRFLWGFEVYKLELDAQNGKVLQKLKLESLGDNVLFVGDYGDSTVAPFSYFSNCLQKDSIYYNDDRDDGSPNHHPHDPFDLRVYNVKEGRFTQQYILNPSFKRVSPSSWILPPFQWD